MKKKWLQIISIVLALVIVGGASFFLGGISRKTEESAPETVVETAVVPEEEASTGTIRGKVLLDNGEMVASGVIIENQNGEKIRETTNTLGGYDLQLDPGKYKLTFTHGPEYSTVDKEVTVESFKIVYMQDVRLVELTDLYSQGWVPGDLHMHSYYSDGANSAESQLYSNISQGLYFAFLTDHNSARGLSEWTQGNKVMVNRDEDGNERMFHALEGVEVTTEFGHFQSLGVGLTFDTYEVLLRDIERSKTGEERDQIIKDKITYIADTIRHEGGVPQINHPFSASTMGFNYWDIADHFDTIEIWNGVFVPGDGRHEPEKSSQQGQNYRAKLKWFELLNEVKNGGKFFAATGGTDNHNNGGPYTPSMDVDKIENMEQYQEVYARNGKYSGVPTTYVHCPDGVSRESILDGLRNGHSFISNGVSVLADVDGASYGDTATLTDKPVKLNVNLFSREGLEKLRIVKNGETMLEIPLDGSQQSYEDTIELEAIKADDWIVLEAFGTESRYAITNPIFFK